MRTRLRGLAEHLAAQDPATKASIEDQLASWAWRPISEDASRLLGQWAAIAGQASEEDFLRDHGTELTSEVFTADLETITGLVGIDAFLERAETVTRMIRSDGVDNVIRMRSEARKATQLAYQWLQTPNWGASEQFLRQHVEALREPALRQVIAQTDNQHHAILSLADSRPINEVYDIVTSTTDAASAALDLLPAADAEQLSYLIAANENVISVPGIGAVVFAATLFLSGEELPDQLVEFVEATTPDESKPLLTARLTQLAERHERHAKEVNVLLDAINQGESSQ